MRYTKQPLDYPDIITMLKERGLIVHDDDKAISCLRVISYFRLANYFRPMEADKTTHVFKPNSYFENAAGKTSSQNILKDTLNLTYRQYGRHLR